MRLSSVVKLFCPMIFFLLMILSEIESCVALSIWSTGWACAMADLLDPSAKSRVLEFEIPFDGSPFIGLSRQ